MSSNTHGSHAAGARTADAMPSSGTLAFVKGHGTENDFVIVDDP